MAVLESDQMSLPTQPIVSGTDMARSPRRFMARKWVSVLLNVVVFGLLLLLLAVGHYTDWKFWGQAKGALGIARGGGVPADPDWCSAHLVPSSVCIECYPERWPKLPSFGFCRDHGVADCVLHHPELAQVAGQVQLPRYDTVRAIAMMARPVNNSRNTLHSRRVQLASADVLQKAQIEVDIVHERPMRDVIEAPGRMEFNPSRVAHLASRVPGTIVLVTKTVGDQVHQGEILAVVDSSVVGQAKSQFIQAVVQLQLRSATVARLNPLATQGAVPQRSFAEAEAALREAETALLAARQTLANLGFQITEELSTRPPAVIAKELQFLGLPEEVIQSLPAHARTSNLIGLEAPFDGVITDGDVVLGEVVDSQRTLFTLADANPLWLWLDVRQEDVRYVQLGMEIEFQTDDGSEMIHGTVSWISPSVNEATRSVPVRVIVPNPDRKILAGSFGRGRIIVRSEPHAVVVPVEAVQSTSDAHFVFVRDKNFFDPQSPKFFYVRQVRLGARDDQYVELLAGAVPGEVVATRGSEILLAQLLRANLGVPCGCHDK